MEAPVWITAAGSLGVVPEGKFYRIALEAEDPDDIGNPAAVTYSLIAGALPSGVQVNTNGTIEGIPISVADFKGVPSEVSENTESKFAIRVVDVDGQIADRTFTLTVSGQDKPTWITPPGRLGAWLDGSEVEYQLLATDLDPGDIITMTLVSGSLPEGLTLSEDGLISGFAIPLKPLGITADPRFDADGTSFDEFPFGFTSTSISQNYQFTVRLTDGKDIVLRTFEIFIHSHDNTTVDSDLILADSGNITADTITVRSPYITNHLDSIGRYRHDNYFAYKFEGEDPDGESIQYYMAYEPETPEASSVNNTFVTVDADTITIDGLGIMAGLSIDLDTGWLHGYLPNIGLIEETYTFGIKVFKKLSTDIESLLYMQTITLYGDIDTEVVWITDADLGVINNGDISTLFIEAVHADTELFYRLKSGENNKLPQGLQLLPSGNIIGQVSFKTFTLDSGATTFEEDFATRLGGDPTTFDLTFRFIGEAYSLDNIVSVTKEFTILVNREYDSPHSPVYCKALPPVEDRILIDTLLSNTTVIPTDALYRADDPNFGVTDRVVYNHAYGLAPLAIEEYFAALELNHYNKSLVLGEIKTARALDDNENIIYEVVYSQIVDTYVNAAGESVPPVIPIKYPAYDNGSLVSEVYPNSLDVMRERLIDEIGQISKVLPTWMLSKQEDGIVPGFVAAWVIAYTEPGKSKFLQYNIEEFFGTQLNLIDFEIDRYTLDSKLSEYWQSSISADSILYTADTADITADVSAGWLPGIQTTFDRTETTSDTTQVLAGDDQYYIDGWVTVETDPLPDGYVPRDPGLYGSEYETIFDGGSCRFISPVDTYNASDNKDKYIKFPRTHIINNNK